jgi:hypothetical protein
MSCFLPGHIKMIYLAMDKDILIHIMNQQNALFFTLFRYHASICFVLFLAHHQEAKWIM